MSSLLFSYNSLLSTPDMAKHILVLEIEIRKKSQRDLSCLRWNWILGKNGVFYNGTNCCPGVFTQNSH